ncbi:MAG: ABC transporter permease [Nitrosomonas sp.]|nr:ABC transporter permease [Nitrosomonas sp.]
MITDMKFALRNLIRQKHRSFMALGAVAFGITALVIASGFIQWIFLDFRETSIRSQLGHIQIVRPGYFDAGKADPYAYLLPDALSDFFARDFDDNQIQAIVPRLNFSGLISHEEATLSFIGEGVDPAEQQFFGDALQISSGGHLSADKPNQIIIGEGLARNLGVKVGNTIVLLVNTATGGINAVEATVGGLFTTVTKSYDDNALRLPIDTARELLRTQGVHRWIVLLNNTDQTDTVLSKLRAILPADQFEIIPWYELADFYNKTIVLFTRQVQGIKIIIALIILLSISNTMSRSVMERTGEIGTAMALGIKKADILRQFLIEGALIGVIGGLIGLFVGMILAQIISSIGIPMPPPPGMARGYTGEILMTLPMAGEALLLAIFTTLVASVYPAWKASHMQIVDALRHNR